MSNHLAVESHDRFRHPISTTIGDGRKMVLLEGDA